MKTRTIGVVTTARSDYGIYRPVLRAIEAEETLRLQLFVGGMHLAPQYGMTVRTIEADGFEIVARVEMLMDDSPEGIAKSMSRGVGGFAEAYAKNRPDLLVVLGDRFEMLAAAVTALPFNIPLAHIHGGESTEGLIDEAIRHSLTKMSHLHFVSTETYARRVIQMGEEPARVVVSGAPSLDNLREVQLLGVEEINERFGLALAPPFVLVTHHPVTLEPEKTAAQIDDLVAALDAMPEFGVLFTYPNADTESRKIIERIETFCAKNPRAKIAVNLGTQGYFSVMSHAAAMVGNSSSGIIEAASFQLPVVNIGKRQRGRVTGKNVLHVGASYDEILAGIRQATSSECRNALADLKNPYGDGHASGRIVQKLRAVELGSELLMKRFHNLS